MSTPTLNRRHFLTGAAGLATLGLTRPGYAQNASNAKLNIAVIGAMGKGQSDTHNVAAQHNIVALVDVDQKRLDAAISSLGKFYVSKGIIPDRIPAGYTDFRKMFDQMGRVIDAVIVSTPDHTHFSAAMWAIEHKKHVCVQKPLCNTITEVRELHQAAKKAGVITQMGNQGRTMDGQRRSKEWIDQGAIGKVTEVRLWTNRPIWPQGPIKKQLATCPPELNWDAWLAQEAEEPYFVFDLPGNTSRRGNSVHPFNWRGWWQFGCGALGDMGCHIMDATFNILGRHQPTRVDVVSGPYTELTAPEWSFLTYHMPNAGPFPGIKVTWHDGIKDGKPNKPERDPRVPQAAFDKASSGMMFIGTEGVLFEPDAYCVNPDIYPVERFAEVKRDTESGKIKKTEERSPQPGNPQLEWAHCIVNGGLPSSNFDYSAPLTEFVLLGNLAVRSGEAIEWNAERGRVSNVKTANKHLKREEYRKGWV